MARNTSYDDAEFQKVVRPLRSAAMERPVDERLLREDLEAILSATGALTESDEERAFAEAVYALEFRGARGRDPSVEELALRLPLRRSKAALVKANLYRKIAHASDALLSNTVRAAIEIDRVTATELRAVIGTRGTRRVGDSGADLLSDSQSLRRGAERLSIFHQSFVKRGQPRKHIQETLLWRLAEIYLRHTGSSDAAESLPHSVRSRFMIFAAAALRPFFAANEVTLEALSSAWSRMKRAASEVAEHGGQEG